MSKSHVKGFSKISFIDGLNESCRLTFIELNCALIVESFELLRRGNDDGTGPGCKKERIFQYNISIEYFRFKVQSHKKKKFNVSFQIRRFWNIYRKRLYKIKYNILYYKMVSNKRECEKRKKSTVRLNKI